MNKRIAHSKVQTAINSGKLTRPDSCSKCGKAPKRGKDGRATVQAHHEDYDHPLDVTWVCASCHGKEHPNRLGEKNGMNTKPEKRPMGEKHGCAKLKESDVIKIISSDLTTNELVLKYNVSYSAIYKIRNGTKWKHIARDK